MKLFSILPAAVFLTTTGFAASAFAAHHESGDHAVAAELGTEETVWASGGRAVVAEVEGEVIAVDLETREVVVRGPAGNFVTLTAIVIILKHFAKRNVQTLLKKSSLF